MRQKINIIIIIIEGRQPKTCAGLLLTIIRKSVLTIEATNTLLNPIKQLNEAITKMFSKRLLTLLLRTIKYAYFSPFTAAWFKLKRGGGYIRYVLALHRLAKWHLN